MSKEYKECYVAFLDIMGFKNLVMTEECNYIYDIFQRIKINSQTKFNLNNTFIEAFFSVKHYVMSDSIVLFIESSVKDSFFALTRTCQILQMSLLALPTPITLRGGISKGPIFCEDDIIFGKGLVNSYLLEENTAINPRIIFTKKILDQGQESYEIIKKGIDALSFFKDSDELYCINFMSIEMFTDFADSAKYLDNILTYCQKNIDDETNERIRSKYLWLKKTSLQLAFAKKTILSLSAEGIQVAQKWNIEVK